MAIRRKAISLLTLRRERSRGFFVLTHTHWLCDNCRIHSVDKKNCSAGNAETEVINVKSYANADDVLIAWQPDQWPGNWVGFKLERRDETSQQITVLVNRIPPKAGEGPVEPTGMSSAQSPIRRCIWTDHSVWRPTTYPIVSPRCRIRRTAH